MRLRTGAHRTAAQRMRQGPEPYSTSTHAGTAARGAQSSQTCMIPRRYTHPRRGGRFERTVHTCEWGQRGRTQHRFPDFGGQTRVAEARSLLEALGLLFAAVTATV